MPAATIARMNRLDTEHQRLFASDPDATAEGRLRHLVLAVCGPADWAPLSAVWRGVQADLDLPAPAIAVNGVDAFELWFSLADPVPAHTAAAFLDGLCDRYLGEVAPARRRCWPSSDPRTAGRTGACAAAASGDRPLVGLCRTRSGRRVRRRPLARHSAGRRGPGRSALAPEVRHPRRVPDRPGPAGRPSLRRSCRRCSRLCPRS